MTTRMATEEITRTTEKAAFAVEGLALLETVETMPEEMKLTAYVFDPVGKLLGSAPLDPKGRFHVPVHLARPADVQLVVGPAGETDVLRASRVYKENFLAKDWSAESGRYLLKPRLFVHKTIWDLWKPVPIFVTGHVRTSDDRPIPFLTVEIFDVDREGFFWPYLTKKAATFPPNLKVIRIPDLLGQTPVPPRPDPVFGERQDTVMPQAAAFPENLEPFAAASSYVGEMATAAPAVAEKLASLTLTSKSPIWRLFRCFSTELVDTVQTDRDGAFCALFRWWPYHVRLGRLRHDPRPDLIVRVTQVIDGVKKVLYMDPYTSTRWDVTNTHIDLWLDDPEFVSGSQSQAAPANTQTFFTRIGNDEVFHIDQTTGLGKVDAPYPNAAYGYLLDLRGQFGKALCAASPMRYYRMSYRKGTSGSFTPITTPLWDVRVSSSLTGETHYLGPCNVNGTPGLYEVRDLQNYFWYQPDRLIQNWDTRTVESNTGVYTLQLEVFDENGKLLPNVDYRDGTQLPDEPSGELPKMEHCNLVLAVQNQRPQVQLKFPNVPANGVLPWSATQAVGCEANITQEGGRIYRWGLYYTKGLNPSNAAYPFDETLSAGVPTISQSLSLPLSSMGITTSNSLAFKLWAWSHIRNGYSNYIYGSEQVTGIAIEKCPECPKLAASNPAFATT